MSEQKRITGGEVVIRIGHNGYIVTEAIDTTPTTAVERHKRFWVCATLDQLADLLAELGFVTDEELQLAAARRLADAGGSDPEFDVSELDGKYDDGRC